MASDSEAARYAPKRPGTGRQKLSSISSLLSGWSGTCPRCGQGRLFASYVKMQPGCKQCGLELTPYRADDAPAYFTILLVGHIVVPGLLLMEQTLQPETWVQMAVWMPVTLALTLALLPRIKGTIIGVQWLLNVRN